MRLLGSPGWLLLGCYGTRGGAKVLLRGCYGTQGGAKVLLRSC